MTLKGVCNTLSRRPQALDVVMLFTQSVTLLQPLCHILDNWQEHEDQGLPLSGILHLMCLLTLPR